MQERKSGVINRRSGATRWHQIEQKATEQGL